MHFRSSQQLILGGFIMNTTEQVKKIAANHMQSILSFTKDHNAPFKSLVTVNVDGGDKPLLLLGMADGKAEKSYCMGILNPDSYLVEHACSNLALYEHVFKKTVAKHCDLAILVWVNPINKDGVSPRGYRYIAQKSKPVDFIIH